MISDADHAHLRAAIALSRSARGRGNAPYGAVLVSAQGAVLATAENGAVTSGDPTAHAETRLVREAAPGLDAAARRGATLYASGEPCPMCAGAIYAAGIGRLVFALGQARMQAIEGGEGGLRLRAAEVLARGLPRVAVEGPALEEEAAEVLLGR